MTAAALSLAQLRGKVDSLCADAARSAEHLGWTLLDSAPAAAVGGPALIRSSPAPAPPPAPAARAFPQLLPPPGFEVLCTQPGLNGMLLGQTTLMAGTSFAVVLRVRASCRHFCCTPPCGRT